MSNYLACYQENVNKKKDKATSKSPVPFKQQKEFANLIFKEKVKYPCAITSIRAGKTFMIKEIAQWFAWNNPDKTRPVVIGAPTYQLLKDVTMGQYLNMFDPFIERIHKTDHIAFLKNGNQIWFRSAHDPSRWRGFEAAVIIGDEIQDWPEESIKNAQGRLIDSGGPFIGACTPSGYNHIYEMWEENPTKEHKYVNWSMYDNPGLVEDDIRAFEDSIGPDYARQEVYGLFTQFTGSPFKHFDVKENVVTPNQMIDKIKKITGGDVKITEDPLRVYLDGNQLEPIITMDFNVNPMTATILLDVNDYIFIIDYVELPNSTTEEMIAKLKAKYKEAVKVYPDPTVTQRTTQTRRTNRSLLLYAGYKLIYKRVAPHHMDRVETTNHYILNSKGERRLLVLDHCRPVRNSFLYTQWAKDGNHILKNGKEHFTDSVGYYLDYEHSIVKFKRELWT